MKARIGKERICGKALFILFTLVNLTGELAACGGGSGANPAYTIGGGISGLSTSGLILANGAATVQVASNASSFKFAVPVVRGAAYAVTIQAQPAGQTCLVNDGTGIVPSAAVGSVKISCTGPWSWSSGSQTNGIAGVYGTRGVAAAGSVPGARVSAVTWTDSAGNFWLFGGTYFDATGNLFYLNDLWRYTPSNGLWTWMSGASTPSAVYGTPGNYGVQGVASASNAPGSRASAVSWTDAAGNFWLFGGQGYDSSNSGYLNDLWKYDPTTGEWTWVNGPSSSSPPVAVYGTQGVAATANVPGPRVGSSSWIDGSGNLWLFGGYGDSTNTNPYVFGYLNDLWEFSPTTGMWTWVSGSSSTVNAAGVYGTLGTAASANVPGARSGAGSWIDSTGSLWLFGGDGFGGFLNDLWKFTPSTNQWTWVSGGNAPNVLGVYGTHGATAATNVPGSRAPAAFWIDAAGNFWLIGGSGISAPQTSDLFNDLWVFSPATGEWTWVSGSSSGGAAGVYGTLGTAAPGNVPGARDGAAAWIDGAGNLWLFGGQSDANPLAGGELNDLWQYRR
jgi:N-acetylneuraminic acid mutarotase